MVSVAGQLVQITNPDAIAEVSVQTSNFDAEFGRAGGAVVNTLFMDHFQKMAQGHFTVRRLERKYGEGAVKTAYEQLPGKPGDS